MHVRMLCALYGEVLVPPRSEQATSMKTADRPGHCFLVNRRSSLLT